MTQKIVNLVKKLSKEERIELHTKIKRDYALEDGETMLRDDIKDKVIELMKIDFNTLEEVKESDYFRDIGLEAMDIVAFADVVVKNFGLEDIEFSNIMAWQTVKDIVNCVEDRLEYIDADFRGVEDE